MTSAPALEELREVCQPNAKLASRNGEHWAGRMYMRRISLRTTRQLVRTRVTPDALTWTMVVCGVASGFALLIPGLTGAVLAAVLFQLFLLFDCVDGEVARWRGQNSATGIYVDRLGAYLADAALMIGAGFRAAHGSSDLWVSVGLAAALGVVLLKASTDLVDVARHRRGLPVADDEATRPRSRGSPRPAVWPRPSRSTGSPTASRHPSSCWWSPWSTCSSAASGRPRRRCWRSRPSRGSWSWRTWPRSCPPRAFADRRPPGAFGAFAAATSQARTATWTHARRATSSPPRPHDSFRSAMSRETSFWSSVVHSKFFRKAAASPPLFEKSALRYFCSGVFG